MGVYGSEKRIIYSDNKKIPEKNLMSDSFMENPYIGPLGKDIYSEEELNAAYASIKENEMKRELEIFYSLPLNVRQSIIKQYILDYNKFLESSKENEIHRN